MLKLAQFYVLQGKKIKITLIKGPRSRKKNSIIGRKNTEIYKKKLLKKHLLSALKLEKVTNNKALFE